MSTAPIRRLSEAEYLAIERQAPTRSDFYDGEMFAMAGTTYEHTVIKDNIARHAGNQLEGGPCRALTSDMRVKVNATGLYTYPDIVIVCASRSSAQSLSPGSGFSPVKSASCTQ